MNGTHELNHNAPHRLTKLQSETEKVCVCSGINGGSAPSAECDATGTAGAAFNKPSGRGVLPLSDCSAVSHPVRAGAPPSCLVSHSCHLDSHTHTHMTLQ